MIKYSCAPVMAGLEKLADCRRVSQHLHHRVHEARIAANVLEALARHLASKPVQLHRRQPTLQSSWTGCQRQLNATMSM